MVHMMYNPNLLVSKGLNKDNPGSKWQQFVASHSRASKAHASAHLRRTRGASWALGLPSWGLRGLGQRDLGFSLGFINKDSRGRGLGLGALGWG